MKTYDQEMLRSIQRKLIIGLRVEMPKDNRGIADVLRFCISDDERKFVQDNFCTELESKIFFSKQMDNWIETTGLYHRHGTMINNDGVPMGVYSLNEWHQFSGFILPPANSDQRWN